MHPTMQGFLSYIAVYLACSSAEVLRIDVNGKGDTPRNLSLERRTMAQGTTGDDAWWVYYNASLHDSMTTSGTVTGGKSSSTSKTTTSKSSTKTSSSYSSYHGRNYASSSYRYTPSSYRPMYSTYLLTFLLIYDIAYLEMNFIDVDETQYCPLNGCRFINETTINTPLRRNVSMTEMIRQTNHTQNATTFQTIWKTTYGCSIHFDECLTSHADPSFSYFGCSWKPVRSYVVLLTFLGALSLQYGTMFVFLCFYG